MKGKGNNIGNISPSKHGGKIIAGGLTATILILLVAVSNAAGYIANAITDPKNWYIWGTTAVIVFALAAIIETYKDEDNKGGD